MQSNPQLLLIKYKSYATDTSSFLFALSYYEQFAVINIYSERAVADNRDDVELLPSVLSYPSSAL